jgi:hypothetical protein
MLDFQHVHVFVIGCSMDEGGFGLLRVQAGTAAYSATLSAALLPGDGAEKIAIALVLVTHARDEVGTGTPA